MPMILLLRGAQKLVNETDLKAAIRRSDVKEFARFISHTGQVEYIRVSEIMGAVVANDEDVERFKDRLRHQEEAKDPGAAGMGSRLVKPGFAIPKSGRN